MQPSPRNSHHLNGIPASPAVSPEAERHLLHRIAAGETEAFWEIWLHYRPLFAHYCRQWMHNRADAEDALSGASLRGAQQLPMYAHQITNVKAWLTRLLYHYCMNIHRARYNHGRYVASALFTTAGGRTAPSLSQKHLEDTLLDSEMRQHIHWTISQLPWRLQTPVLMYFFHDMSPRDIATRLHLSPAAVRKRLQSGRTILRKKLTPYLTDRPALWNMSAYTDGPSASPCEAPRLWAHHVDTLPQTVPLLRAMPPTWCTLVDGGEPYAYQAGDHLPVH